MARANNTVTLLALDVWAQIMGINPYFFNQVGTDFPNPSSNQCEDVWYQYQWQKDFLSREEIAVAIASAEQMIANQVHYYPAPQYITLEPVQYPTFRNHNGWGHNGYSGYGGGWGYGYLNGIYGYYPSVQTQFHRVRGGGVMVREFIDNTANLVYTDTNNDGVDDLFTASVATTVTDPEEIVCYFKDTDRGTLQSDIDETWRIRPVKVIITAGTAVITGHPSLLVVPDLTSVVDPVSLSVTDAATFVTGFAVYRVYRDSAQAGYAYWELLDGCTETPCTLEVQDICLGDRNGKMGQVFAAYNLDGSCCTGWRSPDKVSINYLSGIPLVNGNMNPEWARIVAYLATGLLPEVTCGCERADRIIAYWRMDVTRGMKEIIPRALTAHEQLSPFGFSQGALYAWNRMPEKESITGASF